MKRHVNDRYVRLAQQEGKVSRSYFKLQELDKRFSLFRKHNNNVVDLGAAPGGWTSYVAENYPRVSTVVAVDINPLDQAVLKEAEALREFRFMRGDFVEVREGLQALLADGKASIVLSDMAPNFCGDRRTDAVRAIGLCEQALAVALGVLDKGGCFVGKYFSAPEELELRDWSRQSFKSVRTVKPKASRKSSSERYLVCTGYLK
mmetsp:Transcript_5241/g.9072  ORF Transcript_5241/g.9072 Transcript_5241/m.9072 type:complete len:204 (-) Transcript_5241:1166-1777(-)